MINFIIYEDDECISKNYQNIIHKFMGKSNERYRICSYEAYNAELKKFIYQKNGKNIYILDLEVPGKSGLDLAREIRKYGKISDQIIIVSAHSELKENAYHSKLLMLDFISKLDSVDENVISCIKHAYELLEKEESLIFKQDGEIIKIQYNDILCIEKDHVKQEINVITRAHKIPIKKSITEINNILSNNLLFYKTNRSCIVNLLNVTRVDIPNQVIMLGKYRTTNLARERKKEFEKRLVSISNQE